MDTIVRTCRFCRGMVTDRRDDGVKYGVRSYAHFSCYLDAGKPLAALRDWQIVRFPWRLLRDNPQLMATADAAYRRELSRAKVEG